MKIEFKKYDEVFFRFSKEWLADEEIKRLTMTPDIDEKDRIAWFEKLEQREDYFIRGIMVDGVPVGAVGIKGIDYTNSVGEYWGYIGEKNYIGKGIGKYMLEFAYEMAEKLELRKLVLHVSEENIRACSLYCRQGFQEILRNDGVILMEKIIKNI